MRTYSFAKISARNFPTLADIRNPWIFPNDVAVVICVSQYYDEALADVFKQRGAEYHYLPLEEEVDDIGWENVKKAVAIILQADKEDKRVVVHCDFGAHRSRLVVEAFHFAKFGKHFTDEYHGYSNRIIYNCSNHHLPPLEVVEQELVQLAQTTKNKITMNNIFSNLFQRKPNDTTMGNTNDNSHSLERFLDAQAGVYATALAEIRNGKKWSHWIWYIFPQIRGLGHSYNSKYYGIESPDEARTYLCHEVLGKRLREITGALLEHRDKSATDILGDIDAKKVRSSMTLFDMVLPNDIFAEVLAVFYGGHRCRTTQHITQRQPQVSDIHDALEYIGVDPADFALKNEMFERPNHQAIHGIGHIYRTMVGCALLGLLLERPREGLLAFCGAYIHDLARRTDYVEPEHGANAANNYFERFNSLWDRYNITEEERNFIRLAVTQHSGNEWMRRKDEGYNVMAILKDADALDRCRLGDLNEHWLRYRESRMLVEIIKCIYNNSFMVNEDIGFDKFIDKYCKLVV